jgi:hypothetical protein
VTSAGQGIGQGIDQAKRPTGQHQLQQILFPSTVSGARTQ